MDSRITQHAEIIVNWSTQVLKGDMVLIRTGPEAHDLLKALAREIAKKGASYAIMLEDNETLRSYLTHANNQTLSLFPKHYEAILRRSDVVIWVDAPESIESLADIDSEKLTLRARTREPLFEISLGKRWCDTLHPCDALANQAGMTLEEYKDFVYNAILIDWDGLSRKMTQLSEKLNLFDDIRILGPKTDLYAKTIDRIWHVESGKHNMPSGEVYTSPVEDSVEGRVFFDLPLRYQGNVIKGISLEFERGRVIKYSAEHGQQILKSILNLDEGSNRLGEIAIGMNYGIKRFSSNMLFDEKMGDTIHCALGKSLKECGGFNESAIHVDMIKTMTAGEIVVGDRTIYKEGKFLY